jgi:hypothetical protein
MPDQSPPEKPDRSHIYFQQWKADVISIREQAWDARKSGFEYARLGLQSAFIMNGGALVALPPLMQWLSDDKRALVPIVAVLFIFGIILAAACAIVSYLNFMHTSDAIHAQGEQNAIKLNAQYEGRPFANDPNHEKAKTAEEKSNENAKCTMSWALGLGIASYVCFAVGAGAFIALAFSSNPATEAKATNSVLHRVLSNTPKEQAAKPTPTSPASPPPR